MQARVDQFLHYLKHNKGYSDNTVAAYRNDLNQFLDFLGDLRPETWSQVSEEQVSLYARHLEQGQYAAATVARKIASVKSFFHHLVNSGILLDDPTATLDSPRVEKGQPRTLCREEIEKLLAEPLKTSTPKGLRDAALLNLIYSTGMRVSEVVSLQLGDVDLDQKIVLCPCRDDSQRQLPISERALEKLGVYLEKGRCELLGSDQEKTLFLNHRGQPLSRQGLWLIIKNYAEAAALGLDVTPHTLRHSFAAHRLEHGSTLDKVQELLGHASISATKIYAPFTPPSDESNVEDQQEEAP
jgi:integrase/recombinase XerD